MVKDVIDILNQQLEGIKSDQAVYGLAQSVLRVQGTERELLPAIIQKDGEAKYVGLDDIKSLIVYHKALSSSSALLSNGKGDNQGDIINTYSMGLFVYWDRNRLDLMPDEILMIVQARFPQLIQGMPDVKVLRIRIGTTIMNSLQVYSQEYQEAQPKLPANIHLMQINYTIELTFNPACVKACP